MLRLKLLLLLFDSKLEKKLNKYFIIVNYVDLTLIFGSKMSLRQEACGIKINKLEREMLTNTFRTLVNN